MAQIIQGFQTIVSRSVQSSAQHVGSITQIDIGISDNVIAETARISGTVRSLSREARAMCKDRMFEICKGAAEGTVTEIELNYLDELSVTQNDPAQTGIAQQAATCVVGERAVNDNSAPSMGAEDLSFM